MSGQRLSLDGTDIIFQPFNVYIEGVEVPFISGTVTNGLGQLPFAVISVPVNAGIADISRYYQPKVHIFYTDLETGEQKLLFRGNIAGSQYSKSASGSVSITFQCKHALAFLDQLKLDYSGVAKDASSSDGQAAGTGEVNPLIVNSQIGVTLAMEGITSVSAEDVDTLKQKGKYSTLSSYWTPFFNEGRFTGIPGVLVNFWNQLKGQAHQVPEVNDPMLKMYVPLVEVGTRFFQRFSGHKTLESIIDTTGREAPCRTADTDPNIKFPDTVLVPPAFKMLFRDAVTTYVARQALLASGQYSSEKTSLLDWYKGFLEAMEYDLVVLNSPAYRRDRINVVETIAKPQLPFYYSPLCNVYYPFMYSELSITQQDDMCPTRVSVISTIPSNDGGREMTKTLTIRAPHFVRQAIAERAVKVTVQNKVPTLSDTIALSYNAISKFEYGQGIRNVDVIMPDWLSLYSSTSAELPAKGQPNDANAEENAKTEKIDPGAEPQADSTGNTKPITEEDVFRTNGESFTQAALKNARAAWAKRYGANNAAMNPFESVTLNGLKPYQRILISSADYYLTRHMAASRLGDLSGIFNPYIIPGYPMDIIDKTPEHPSWHAFCANVTHNFTGESCSTSVQFLSAITYDEMYLYYMPYVTAWLQEVMGLVEAYEDLTTSTSVVSSANGVVSSLKAIANLATARLTATNSIIGNARALTFAEDYYSETLGCGAAAPEVLYDFSTGQPFPVSRSGMFLAEGSQSREEEEGLEKNPYLSGRGNLMLVKRPIETKRHVEGEFGINFIGIDPSNFSEISVAYNRILGIPAKSAYKLEPGESQYLNYDSVPAGVEDWNATKYLKVFVPVVDPEPGAGLSGLMDAAKGLVSTIMAGGISGAVNTVTGAIKGGTEAAANAVKGAISANLPTVPKIEDFKASDESTKATAAENTPPPTTAEMQNPVTQFEAKLK